jgi:hypothetical protein
VVNVTFSEISLEDNTLLPVVTSRLGPEVTSMPTLLDVAETLGKSEPLACALAAFATALGMIAVIAKAAAKASAITFLFFIKTSFEKFFCDRNRSKFHYTKIFLVFNQKIKIFNRI